VVNVISSLAFDDISPVHMTTSDLKRLIGFLDELNVRCARAKYEANPSISATDGLKTVELIDEGYKASDKRQ